MFAEIPSCAVHLWICVVKDQVAAVLAEHLDAKLLKRTDKITFKHLRTLTTSRHFVGEMLEFLIVLVAFWDYLCTTWHSGIRIFGNLKELNY